jgi:hypothetical protein
MRKSIFWMLLFSMISNIALADCDWTKIKNNGDGTYTYSKELHICVGQTVEDNKTKDLQIQDLTKAVSLKDLAIQKSDERTQLWIDTSLKLEKNIQAMDSFKKTDEWLYFGLGALTIFASGIAAAQLTNRH